MYVSDAFLFVAHYTNYSAIPLRDAAISPWDAIMPWPLIFDGAKYGVGRTVINGDIIIIIG